MTTAIGAYATAAAVKTRLGITDSTDDTLIGTMCDQINQYIETVAGRVLAPVSSAVYLFDGNGRRTLYVPNGVRAVTLLQIASGTNGTLATVSATDYFLRPLPQDRDTGWPATSIELSDLGSWRYFPIGYANVSVTMTTGWAAIPDDITDIALTTAVRAWHGRQSGQADVIGSDDTGAPVVSRFVSGKDRETLRGYRSARKYGV